MQNIVINRYKRKKRIYTHAYQLYINMAKSSGGINRLVGSIECFEGI